MDAVLQQLRKEGYPVRDEDAARLSPTTHKHINYEGEVFVRDAGIGDQR